MRPREVEQFARREIFFERAGIERGGHDDEFEVGPRRFLQVERAGERDVAVEMPLVEFVEEDRGDAAQLGIRSICRSRTPSVTKRMRVLLRATLSNRIW